MVGKLATRLAIWLLRHGKIGNEEKQLLTACMLDRVRALPLHAKITVDETGKCFVDGRSLNLETAVALREAAVAMQKNFARKFVKEQIRWMAINVGIFENATPEQGIFGKAALWIEQEENKLYEQLAPKDTDDLP